MISTLITTLTASNSASLADTTSMTSAYDAYMFVMTDIGPATDSANFQFQVNEVDGSGYDEIHTAQTFMAEHDYDDGTAQGPVYRTGQDSALDTTYQTIMESVGNASVESGAGILHVFGPSNATFVTHFHSTMQYTTEHPSSRHYFAGGYFHKTTGGVGADGPIAIDEISFKMSSGNFDGVIQIYGIS